MCSKQKIQIFFSRHQLSRPVPAQDSHGNPGSRRGVGGAGFRAARLEGVLRRPAPNRDVPQVTQGWPWGRKLPLSVTLGLLQCDLVKISIRNKPSHRHTRWKANIQIRGECGLPYPTEFFIISKNRLELIFLQVFYLRFFPLCFLSKPQIVVFVLNWTSCREDYFS